MIETYKKAIEKWGVPAQLLMVVEECNELGLEVLKYLRKRITTTDTIIDEIADVRIMLEQLEYILECKMAVKGRMEYKLKRLEERLE